MLFCLSEAICGGSVSVIMEDRWETEARSVASEENAPTGLRAPPASVVPSW